MRLNEIFWGVLTEDELRVGFTAQGIINLGQIWNFIPRIAVGEKVMYGQAIATVESKNSVKSLCIPIDGMLIQINDEFLEFPEAVTEHMEIFRFNKVNHALLGL